MHFAFCHRLLPPFVVSSSAALSLPIPSCHIAAFKLHTLSKIACLIILQSSSRIVYVIKVQFKMFVTRVSHFQVVIVQHMPVWRACKLMDVGIKCLTEVVMGEDTHAWVQIFVDGVGHQHSTDKEEQCKWDKQQTRSPDM